MCTAGAAKLRRRQQHTHARTHARAREHTHTTHKHTRSNSRSSSCRTMAAAAAAPVHHKLWEALRQLDQKTNGTAEGGRGQGGSKQCAQQEQQNSSTIQQPQQLQDSTAHTRSLTPRQPLPDSTPRQPESTPRSRECKPRPSSPMSCMHRLARSAPGFGVTPALASASSVQTALINSVLQAFSTPWNCDIYSLRMTNCVNSLNANHNSVPNHSRVRTNIKISLHKPFLVFS